ncbi:MAG: DUF2938 family protein [Rhodospirillaceae bacterium]|jgi:hypothetical protein|nr:DUF2938 family protein [Rhodospirillaceae bacterium]MBT3491580.1 DUF2938 family protein [Rhodospirillaceae bacterium]MBT3780690.1 DUF2938 family protein [Rhodospirillaceae bacterium]MBT3976118.1 DUF2938 family protein [Rhodospirillaceae bacterium]MBT4167480.1 DUF2938 family protein [Rhodospirillaceae bacterium]
MDVSWLEILVVGVVANIVTDIYEFLLERGLGKNRDWHYVGRWVAYLGRGVFRHDDIQDTPAVRRELILGWAFHYLVAIVFAEIYLQVLSAILEQPASLWNGLGFGVVTVLAPWLILIPGLGGGFFGAKTGRTGFVLLASLSVHAVFGIGLYLGALVFATI